MDNFDNCRLQPKVHLPPARTPGPNQVQIDIVKKSMQLPFQPIEGGPVFEHPVRWLLAGGLAMLLMLGSIGCTTSSDTVDPRYYEFTHSDEGIDYTFVAKTSDKELIARAERELALPFDQRTLHIHGNLARGSAGYNDPWSWHFESSDWDLVEISAEVCDGRPQMVEDDLEYWLNDVGTFCPWSSRILRAVAAPSKQHP